MTTIHEEIGAMKAEVEIMESVLLLHSFGKNVAGFQLEETPDGQSRIRFDQRAQA